MVACPRLPTRTAAPPPVPRGEAGTHPVFRQRAGRAPRRAAGPNPARALGGRRDWTRGRQRRPATAPASHPARPHPHRHRGKVPVRLLRAAHVPPRPPNGRQRAAIAALPPRLSPPCTPTPHPGRSVCAPSGTSAPGPPRRRGGRAGRRASRGVAAHGRARAWAGRTPALAQRERVCACGAPRWATGGPPGCVGGVGVCGARGGGGASHTEETERVAGGASE